MAIDLVIQPRPRDLGDFVVRRVLPSPERRLVGPFIFWDHFGPVTMPPGKGMNVRPHPHIGLATVTFLFEGAIVHKDSLGSDVTIAPGDVNWMIAGKGIAHSERSSPEVMRAGARLHGIQAWVALPIEEEERAPAFHHYDASALPRREVEGVDVIVIAGAAYDELSPVQVMSPTMYVDARMPSGRTLLLPREHEERAVYVIDGAVSVDGRAFGAGDMIVARPGEPCAVHADADAHVMLLGGAKLAGERLIDWNFVSSRKERIEKARSDWREQRWPTIPGDDVERIPLPER